MISEIASRIRDGESVSAVADALGVTPSAIYMRLREHGQSVRSLRAETAKGVRYRKVRSLGDGYRVGDDGSVQSCVSPRTGELTDHWRSLSPVAGTGNTLLISVGGSNRKTRKRRSLRKLLVDAWGERRGVEIYEQINH